jgi:hypothetical protein
MEFCNTQYLTSFNKSLDVNDIVIKKDVKYIYIKGKNQITINDRNTHFLLIDNIFYFANYYICGRMNNIINNKSCEDYIIYNNLINRNDFNDVYFDKAIIFYINTHSAGHEIASIIYSIYVMYYHNIHEIDIVVNDTILDIGKVAISILYLFFDKSKVHIVSDKDRVNIKETYVFIPDCKKRKFAVDFLMNKLKNSCIIDKNTKLRENICLIKTISNKIMASPFRAFSNDYSLFIKSKGFEIINADEFDVKELFVLINNCKQIILSWGCNSWCNSMYLSENHKLITLCHIGYAGEYSTFNCENFESKLVNNCLDYYQWVPKKINKKIMVYDLETDLTDKAKFLISNAINELNL